MNFQEQLSKLVEEYKLDYKTTSPIVLEKRAVTDIIFLIEKHIEIAVLRLDFNKHDKHRAEILKRSIERLNDRKENVINYLLNH